MPVLRNHSVPSKKLYSALSLCPQLATYFLDKKMFWFKQRLLKLALFTNLIKKPNVSLQLSGDPAPRLVLNFRYVVQCPFSKIASSKSFG